jgi:glucose/arabinose dehydrogenase
MMVATSKDASMKCGVVAVLLFALIVVAVWFFSRVDQRPMSVTVVPAFPHLEWPDWLLGVDEGFHRDPRPLVITGARDGTNRIFAGTQYGTIHVWPNSPDVKKMQTFLDVRDRIPGEERGGEEGFLGLAFHPHYKDNGEFFVYYSGKSAEGNKHHSILSRFHVSRDDPNRADPKSEEVIMRIPLPTGNHHGGTLVFGPDGYLYVGLGDGGPVNDPHGNGQKLDTLLGKILRIDIDHKDPGLEYAIPKDNPFADPPTHARGEIWAYGIRNVWRIAFDRDTGDLWAGDVGQDTWEEIDIIRRGGNYGWSLREAMHSFTLKGNPQQKGSPPRPDLIEPIWEYNHSVGNSIAGGNVYRGKQVPELAGAYLYGDYVTGQIWALWYDRDKQKVTANRSIQPKGLPLMSFGEDDAGEIYFLTQQGDIMKFASPK